MAPLLLDTSPLRPDFTNSTSNTTTMTSKVRKEYLQWGSIVFIGGSGVFSGGSIVFTGRSGVFSGGSIVFMGGSGVFSGGSSGLFVVCRWYLYLQLKGKEFYRVFKKQA